MVVVNVQIKIPTNEDTFYANNADKQHLSTQLIPWNDIGNDITVQVKETVHNHCNDPHCSHDSCSVPSTSYHLQVDIPLISSDETAFIRQYAHLESVETPCTQSPSGKADRPHVECNTFLPKGANSVTSLSPPPIDLNSTLEPTTFHPIHNNLLSTWSPEKKQAILEVALRHWRKNVPSSASPPTPMPHHEALPAPTPVLERPKISTPDSFGVPFLLLPPPAVEAPADQTMNVDKDLDVGAEEGPVEPEEVVVHSGLTSPVLRGQQVPTAPLVDIDQNVDKPPSLSDIEPEPTSPPPTPPAAIVEEHVGDQLPPANETLISPIEQARIHDRVVKMKRRDEHRRSVPQQPQSHAPFTPLRGFGHRGRGGYVGGRGRSGLGRAGFLSSSTGLRHPPEPETQAVAEPNVNLSSTDENALLWEELFGPESPRRPSKRTTNPHPLVFQDTDINCGAQTDKRSRIRKRQLENVVLPPPKKRQWSAAEGVAREWAVAIDMYLDTKRTGRLRPAHDPTSRKFWKNFADAVEEVSCNRQNLYLEIVKNSGLRDSIKATIDRINDDWGVAAMQRRLKAKEVLDCWRKRFT